MRFVRRRFGRYEVIDFVTVLFSYAISSGSARLSPTRFVVNFNNLITQFVGTYTKGGIYLRGCFLTESLYQQKWILYFRILSLYQKDPSFQGYPYVPGNSKPKCPRG